MVCPACFGLSACDGMVGESQSLINLAKSDEGGTMAPSIPLGFCEPLKHVRGTFLSMILGGTVPKARGLISLASHVRQVRPVMSSLADSLSKVGWGDTTSIIYTSTDITRRCARL